MNKPMIDKKIFSSNGALIPKNAIQHIASEEYEQRNIKVKDISVSTTASSSGKGTVRVTGSLLGA